MDEREWMAERFEEQRPRLRAVAYRMLGSTNEADDAVQETWIRLSRSDTGAIANLEAWLVTVAGRVALNMLRARRTRREQPLEGRLADPIVDPVDGIDRGWPTSCTTCSRCPSRRSARSSTALPTQPASSRAAAAREGDFDALLAVLDPDVVVRNDAGSGVLQELRGAETVARGATAFSQQGLVTRPALVNGVAGWVTFRDGDVFSIAALTQQNGRITAIDVPDVLRPARAGRRVRRPPARAGTSAGVRRRRTAPDRA